LYATAADRSAAREATELNVLCAAQIDRGTDVSSGGENAFLPAAANDGAARGAAEQVQSRTHTA
jgi:hypothetical protein